MRLTDPAARKDQHLDVILAGKARHGLDSGFSAVRFVHEALPDLDHGKIDLGVDFLGRRLKAPLLISAMTGGLERKIERVVTEQVQPAVLAICTRLPGVMASQQRLASSLPAFQPYANLEQSDIDNCEDEIRSEFASL